MTHFKVGDLVRWSHSRKTVFGLVMSRVGETRVNVLWIWTEGDERCSSLWSEFEGALGPLEENAPF